MPDMESGMYIRDEHDGEEIRRAIQISTLKVDLNGPLSFVASEGEAFEANWGDWLDGRWEPFLAEHLVEVYMKSRAFEVNDVLSRDVALGDFLDADEAERSLRAGSLFREAGEDARHAGVLGKLYAWMEEEPGRGHAATVFGVHAAAYHLPLFSAMVSYLYLEWKCGATGLEKRSFDLTEERFVVDAMGALGGIRGLLKKHLGSIDPAACA